MADWRYGDVLKRKPDGTAEKVWPHHRLMFVAPGQNSHVFRAVALVHNNRPAVNTDPTVRWDYTRWELTDD